MDGVDDITDAYYPIRDRGIEDDEFWITWSNSEDTSQHRWSKAATAHPQKNHVSDAPIFYILGKFIKAVQLLVHEIRYC